MKTIDIEFERSFSTHLFHFEKSMEHLRKLLASPSLEGNEDECLPNGWTKKDFRQFLDRADQLDTRASIHRRVELMKGGKLTSKAIEELRVEIRKLKLRPGRFNTSFGEIRKCIEEEKFQDLKKYVEKILERTKNPEDICGDCCGLLSRLNEEGYKLSRFTDEKLFWEKIGESCNKVLIPQVYPKPIRGVLVLSAFFRLGECLHLAEQGFFTLNVPIGTLREKLNLYYKSARRQGYTDDELSSEGPRVIRIRSR